MTGKPSRMIGQLGAAWLRWVFAAAVLVGYTQPAKAQEASGPQGNSALAAGLGEALKAAMKNAATTAPAPAAEEELSPTSEPAGDPPDIHVSPQGRVEMHVRELDLDGVLQMLSMQSQRNIIASKDVTGKVTANLYNVTFEEALTAVLGSNGAGWVENGNFIYVYTTAELQQLEAARKPITTKRFQLHYMRAEDVKTLIQPLLSKNGIIAGTPAAKTGIGSSGGSGSSGGASSGSSNGGSSGGGGSSTDTGGDAMAGEDMLIISDLPERLDQVEAMIKEIDVRPQQVLVEATILRAQLNEDNALGIDFNVVGGVDFRNLSSTSNGVTDIKVDGLPTAKLDNTTFAANTDFRGAVPQGGLTFGIIKNNVAAFVRALEQVTDTTVLANPKILALNKQPGEVIVGREDGYPTTTVTETAAVQSVQTLKTGTRLVFRPFVGDNGFIRMEVHPEDSTGGVTSANLPFKVTTEATTNIMIRDGHTILIGGLFRESSVASKSQLPIMGNLPVAGALFRNSHDTTQREEVIILLTVHLIKDEECYAQTGEKLADDVERFRVGMRKGLQWYGRERLAQAHYHWAMEHLAKGRTNRALWDLNLAINNNPKFIAAIKLKEQLLDKRSWDEDSSSVRDFIRHQIMRETGTVLPLYGRPAAAGCLPLLEAPCGFEEDKPDAGAEFGPDMNKPDAQVKPAPSAGAPRVPAEPATAAKEGKL
jgi:type IV pilus assembly protein PilQ